MDFKKHFDLEGQHAFLSPSSYHWINYNHAKLDARWKSHVASRRGVALHDYAQRAIELGIKQSRAQTTLSMYINDAIRYGMTCEQVLYYSPNCFGTADAISFRNSFLRIHDLKTGITPTSHHQLEVYAALFCMEYGVSVYDIDIELRIYQNDEVRVYDGNPDTIMRVMDQIIDLDQRIETLKERRIQ